MTVLPITPPSETEPRFQKDSRGFGTRAVQAGSPHDPVTGAVIEPVSFPPLQPAQDPPAKPNSADIPLDHLRADVSRQPGWRVRVHSQRQSEPLQL